jgi:hypothetical protein
MEKSSYSFKMAYMRVPASGSVRLRGHMRHPRLTPRVEIDARGGGNDARGPLGLGRNSCSVRCDGVEDFCANVPRGRECLNDAGQ